MNYQDADGNIKPIASLPWWRKDAHVQEEEGGDAVNNSRSELGKSRSELGKSRSELALKVRRFFK
jgi:hypothetical protein